MVDGRKNEKYRWEPDNLKCDVWKTAISHFRISRNLFQLFIITRWNIQFTPFFIIQTHKHSKLQQTCGKEKVLTIEQ